MSDAVEGSNRAQRRAALTRLSLLRAGREALVANGFASVTIADITNRADVALGSFYNHFDNREAMVHAVLAEARCSQVKFRSAIDAELGSDGYGPIVGVMVSFIHRAALDPEFADLCHAALIAGYWPDPDQSEVLVAAVRQAAAVSGEELVVPYAAAMFKWLIGAMIAPEIRNEILDLDGSVREIVTMGLRMIGATPEAVDHWVARARAVHVDLSIIDD